MVNPIGTGVTNGSVTRVCGLPTDLVNILREAPAELDPEGRGDQGRNLDMTSDRYAVGDQVRMCHTLVPCVVEEILHDGLTLLLKTGSPRAWELGFRWKYILANPIEVQPLIKTSTTRVAPAIGAGHEKQSIPKTQSYLEDAAPTEGGPQSALQ